jgi:short-subunit dehydrogenase
MEATNGRQLAVVTGASSGIGLELSKQFARHGFDLVIDAEDEGIEQAAATLRALGAEVTSVRADLATGEGVTALFEQTQAIGRPVDAVAINAGVGLAGRFAETDLQAHLALIGLNVTGAVHLTRLVLPAMVARGEGKLLFTSSIAASMPGPYESTYAASKAFLYSFAEAIRNELKGTGVTVTALMPGPTDTNFFARAGMEDTKLGQSKKDDPADVARQGFEALMAGKDHVVAGSFRNKAQVAAAKLLPDPLVASMHGSMSRPGSATRPRTR